MRRSSELELTLALLLAGSMWFYVQYVVIGHQQTEAALHGIPRGNLSDLYPRWLGTRELLLHHRSPYSLEITREIQAGYYGRVLDPHRPDDPRDQMAFAYPLYVVFLLAPTITLPFPIVRLAVHWLFIFLTAWSVLLWLRALQWRASSASAAILVVLTLGSLPVLQGIKLEQLTLLVNGMIAACILLLAAGYPLLAGVLLAFATIKPQLVLLLAGWLMLWACGNYRERRRFIFAFGVTLVTLFAGAEFILPGWLGQFVEALRAYREYTGGPKSILAVITTPRLGLLVSGFILLGLAVVCWRTRRAPADNAVFTLISSLVLAVTVVVIPMISLYNQIILLPAVLLLVRHGVFLWRKDSLTRLLCVIATSLMTWPWLTALLITVASQVMPSQSLQTVWASPLWTSMTIPLAALLLLARFIALTAPELLSRVAAMDTRSD
jgi:MFS family permease